MSERAIRKELKAYADAWKDAMTAGEQIGCVLPNGLHHTPSQRITALEADVARLQWQVAKLLEKPRKRKPKKT